MFSKAQKWATAAGFWVLGIVLLFWSFFENFIPGLNTQRVLSVAMVLGGGMVLYFDDRLSKITDRDGPAKRMALTQAINIILQKSRRIKRLRIIALTEEMITPMFTGQEVAIDRAHILLRDFNGADAKEWERCVDRVEWQITEWNQMHDVGKVKELNIFRYLGAPNEFAIIVDNESMVLGTYFPSTKVDSGIDVGNSFLISGSPDSGMAMIDSWRDAFDRAFFHWQTRRIAEKRC